MQTRRVWYNGFAGFRHIDDIDVDPAILRGHCGSPVALRMDIMDAARRHFRAHSEMPNGTSALVTDVRSAGVTFKVRIRRSRGRLVVAAEVQH